MPTMNFTGIAIDPSSNIRAGDSIINEVCMTNIGTAGDMIYYTGFGYLVSGTIHYIGDGWGNGYSKQTIGAVGINEHLCPYDMVSATQEVIDVSKSGKDVRFFASVGSEYISKAVTFYEPPTPEFCTQVFEIIDQDNNPLRGTISSPTWDTDLPVPNTGVASMYMQKGVTHTVTAHHADKTDSWTFTTCQTDPVTLVIQVESTVGLLVCNSSPDDAEIWIDGSNTGEYTPRSFTNMEKGSYNITFKKDGYHDCSKTVTVIANEGVSAFCSLTKTTTIGQLNCSTQPTGAKIYLDNEYINITNVNIVDLEPGTYDVRYELEGYEVYTKTVTIEAGKTTFLAKVLVPIEEPEGLTGKIGEITHEIVSIDEINFEISVKNISSIDGYFYVDLRDEAGTFLQKAPKITKAISAGQTTTIHMSSVLATFPSWSVEDVENQTITFELKTSDSFGFGKEIVDTVSYKVEEEPTIPDEKECIQYTTQQECEANGCYWHSDNTCQIAPEGTTEYFDVHIKPYSFYAGKYEEAVSKTLTLVTDLTGAMSNYISGITGYEYKGIDILEDANKQVIVVRVYLKDTNETALIAPAIIAGAVIVIAAIMLAIGYIIGTSEGDFSKADITQLAKDIITNAEIDAYEHAYDIDKSTAIKLIDCLRTIETCDDSLTCFENNNVTPSLSNQMEVLVAYETSIDSVYTGVADTIEDAEFEAFATKTLAELEIVIEKLESATITPEGAACVATDVMNKTIADLEEKKDEQEDEECAWEIAGECIITKKAAKTLTIVAVGIGGLMALSAVKGITKK